MFAVLTTIGFILSLSIASAAAYVPPLQGFLPSPSTSGPSVPVSGASATVGTTQHRAAPAEGTLEYVPGEVLRETSYARRLQRIDARRATGETPQTFHRGAPLAPTGLGDTVAVLLLIGTAGWTLRTAWKAPWGQLQKNISR